MTTISWLVILLAASSSAFVLSTGSPTTQANIGATLTRRSLSSTHSSDAPLDTSNRRALSVAVDDEEVVAIIKEEDRRQKYGLELIASENFASAAVRQTLGSSMTNKYSEGLPGARYYGGNTYIDQMERLTQKRALSLYKLDAEEWGVNVQPYSGSPANFAVYTGLLEPGDRIMGLDLPSGGHLTHGFYTSKKKVSATSVYFTSLPYTVNAETGLIDYDEMEMLAGKFLPKLIIAGGSAYPREWDYERMREIADKVGAKLMVDMAHISGLVAGGVVSNPFEYADVVTSTTHKSLRGPRSGIIFAKKELMQGINNAVFPGLQGGPHNNNIAALAVALKEAEGGDFKDYARQVIKNAKALAKAMMDRGMTIVTGGTDNHLMLWDLRPLGISGGKAERVLEYCGITVNKNTLVGDKSAVRVGGIRIGVCALTSRGMKEGEMEKVAEFIVKGVEMGIEIEKRMVEGGGGDKKGTIKVGEFGIGCGEDEGVVKLKSEVEQFAGKWFMPGEELAW